MHLNDLENVTPFFFLGLAYSMSKVYLDPFSSAYWSILTPNTFSFLATDYSPTLPRPESFLEHSSRAASCTRKGCACWIHTYFWHQSIKQMRRRCTTHKHTHTQAIWTPDTRLRLHLIYFSILTNLAPHLMRDYFAKSSCLLSESDPVVGPAPPAPSGLLHQPTSAACAIRILCRWTGNQCLSCGQGPLHIPSILTRNSQKYTIYTYTHTCIKLSD